MQPWPTQVELRDRQAEGPAADSRPVKATIWGRGTQRLLCLACLATVIYGTLGPLAVGGGSWISPVDSFRWWPPRQHSEFNDLLTNLAVYVPVGLAFRLLVRRRGRAGWPDLVVGLFLSVGLSYATELLQQFMPSRSSDSTDILANGVGALAGCLIAVPLQRLLRQLQADESFRAWLRCGLWTWTGRATLGVAFLVMTTPWRLRSPTVDLSLAGGIGLKDPLFAIRIAFFAAMGFALAGTAMVRGATRWPAAVGALLQVALFAGALEAAQTVLREHVGSLFQTLAASLGGGIGAALACVVVTPARSVAARPFIPPIGTRAPPVWSAGMHRLAVAVLAAGALGVLAAGLCSSWHATSWAPHPALGWLPFRAQFQARFTHAVADVVGQCLAYGAVSGLCLLLTQGRGRSMSLLLLLTVLGIVEVSRCALGSCPPDTTRPLLAVVSWVFAGRVWGAVYPQRQENSVVAASAADRAPPGGSRVLP